MQRNFLSHFGSHQRARKRAGEGDSHQQMCSTSGCQIQWESIAGQQSPGCSLPLGSKTMTWFESSLPIPNSTPSMDWVNIYIQGNSVHHPAHQVTPACVQLRGSQVASPLPPSLCKDRESVAIRHLMHEATSSVHKYHRGVHGCCCLLIFHCQHHAIIFVA